MLLVSPVIILIGIAYLNNIFFTKTIIDIGMGILGSLYRNYVIWVLLGIYAFFLLIGTIINLAMSFIERKLKKEEDCDERID